MRSRKFWVLSAVSLLAILTLAWSAREEPFLRFLPFLMLGSLAVSVGMHVLASRLERTDVTALEGLARRAFFTRSRPN